MSSPACFHRRTIRILSEEWGGTWARLELDSTEPQLAVFDWLHVAGWAAYLDGERVDVFAAMPAGLVALELPAGQFALTVTLEPTQLQSLSWALSGLALLAAAASLLAWRRIWPEADQVDGRGEPAPTERSWLFMFAALGVAVFLLKALLLDGANTPIKSARYGAVAAAPALANFGDID